MIYSLVHKCRLYKSKYNIIFWKIFLGIHNLQLSKNILKCTENIAVIFFIVGLYLFLSFFQLLQTQRTFDLRKQTFVQLVFIVRGISIFLWELTVLQGSLSNNTISIDYNNRTRSTMEHRQCALTEGRTNSGSVGQKWTHLGSDSKLKQMQRYFAKDVYTDKVFRKSFLVVLL